MAILLVDYQPSFFQKHRRGKPDNDTKIQNSKLNLIEKGSYYVYIVDNFSSYFVYSANIDMKIFLQ